jgi:hypothetical protein
MRSCKLLLPSILPLHHNQKSQKVTPLRKLNNCNKQGGSMFFDREPGDNGYLTGGVYPEWLFGLGRR